MTIKTPASYEPQILVTDKTDIDAANAVSSDKSSLPPDFWESDSPIQMMSSINKSLARSLNSATDESLLPVFLSARETRHKDELLSGNIPEYKMSNAEYEILTAHNEEEEKRVKLENTLKNFKSRIQDLREATKEEIKDNRKAEKIKKSHQRACSDSTLPRNSQTTTNSFANHRTSKSFSMGLWGQGFLDKNGKLKKEHVDITSKPIGPSPFRPRSKKY